MFLLKNSTNIYGFTLKFNNYMCFCSKIKNMHHACTRNIFLHASKMAESRIHCLVMLSSVFCKNGLGTATPQ